MSDRIKGLTVTLRQNMRDDDAECIINAIRLLNGVSDVCAHTVEPDHYFTVMNDNYEIREKLRTLLGDGSQ